MTADGRPPDVEQTPRQEPGLVPQPAPQQPAPQQPAPQQPAPQQPAPTAEALYREAESALARRDSTAADVALARLLAEYPQSALADQALYERAQLAYRRRAWVDARRHLAALAQLPATPLAEPGRYLVCRIAVETRDGDAVHCLASYRATYPKSAHDRDVLGLLVQLVHARQGCAGARALVDELARRYADSALARAWRATCPEAR